MRPVFLPFLKLGLISFGGPIAHLGYFHTEFVRRRRWLDEAEYADLVALCQFLPGPASSQVVFALGMRRGGLLGAMLASLGFMLPSAVIMIAFAYGVAASAALLDAPWVHGLKLAAVAIVAQAVWSMGRSLCPDRARATLAVMAAVAALAFSGPLVHVGIIAAGALCGWMLYRRTAAAPPCDDAATARGHGAAVLALATFALLLGLLPVAAAYTSAPEVALFDRLYRAGSLVFGGGHVVLPLLRAEVVEPGGVSDSQFLAGYGAAQAVPGPLFTFAGYLGTLMLGEGDGSTPGGLAPGAWMGGALALLAIFLPGWLLVGGALPFWHRLRAQPWAQAALRGTGAAVVGLLLAALYSPLVTEGVRGPLDAATVLAAFVLLSLWRTPPIVVVALCAAAGQWLVGAG